MIATASPVEHPADVRLADNARLLSAWLERMPERLPQRWRSPDFGRLVDLVRTHLRPIGSEALLAFSYEREHFHMAPDISPPSARALLSRDATEVAYALRWLELSSGTPRAPWVELTRSS
jgi:hypothetical protein